MDAGPCRFCGSTNRLGSLFCAKCGGRYPSPHPPAPQGPRYTPLRFQVDPQWPPPQRDVRWILIVLGIALIVVAIFLLVFSAIVSSAVSTGSAGCGSHACPILDPGPWFSWLGLPFLLLGIVLLLLGLWWALR